ncbi:hypothetical protein [Sulfuricurvum sp.]|uniref:hypothetical protein n=1 Tax=Sulfuricurvum sp. TaxID=2025608 RepID=UPI002E337032|nr:hypothetical protein [Sulfuricurvum sp.]HEX5329961.1 hypothetical protein [Sulfuricurvum sp.]
MFWIAELGLFVFAFYRGRGMEALVALLIFIGVIFGLVEFGYDHSTFIHIADLSLIIALGVLSLFPKIDKSKRCPKCNALITESRLSCKECGYLLDGRSMIEKSGNGISAKTVVMKTIDEFEIIKHQIVEKYAPLGYTTRSIDKEDALMLKNEKVENSYILIKRDGFEAMIDLYNVKE